MAENIVELNSENFEKEVLNIEGVVLVDFWAPWCGPCRVMGPILEDFAFQHRDKIKVGKLNVDDHQKIASRYEILSIPTLIVFKGGEVQKRLVGAVPKKKLEEELEPWLS